MSAQPAAQTKRTLENYSLLKLTIVYYKSELRYCDTLFTMKKKTLVLKLNENYGSLIYYGKIWYHRKNYGTIQNAMEL